MYVIHLGILGGTVLLWLQGLNEGSISRPLGGTLLLMLVCAASLIASGEVTYDSFIKVVCLWEMLLAMHIAYEAGSGPDLMGLVKLSAWAVSLGFLMQYFAGLETHYGVYFLGLNKNYSGAMLMLNAAICLVMSTAGSRISRCISAAAFCCSSYLLVVSRCRTGMAVLLAMVAAVFFMRRMFTSRGWKHAVLMAPVAVMLLVLAVPVLNEIEIFGGSGSLMSEREKIYAEYFDQIGSWFFLGNIARYKLANAHNGALTLMASLGMVGYAVWYVNQQAVLEMIRPENSRFSTWSAAYAALVSCMLIACTEAIVYVQGQQISIMMSLFVYVCRREEVRRQFFGNEN